MTATPTDTDARKWHVLLDGEIDATFPTRVLARAHARWLRRHPACVDRVVYGTGGCVQIHHIS